MSLYLLAALGGWFTWLLGPLMLIVALFLMLLILIQRGKGGGLSGAFGGAGGQSAFGARAGDTIMWVTVWVAIAWILLCLLSVKLVTSNSKWAQPPVPGLSNPGEDQGGGQEAAEGEEGTGPGLVESTPTPGGDAPADDSGSDAPASGE